MILFLLRVILAIVWFHTIFLLCLLFALLLWDLKFYDKSEEILKEIWNIKD